MPLAKLIEVADQEQRNFIFDLYGHVSQHKLDRIDRRVLEIKRGLSRAKSNQIFNHWLKAGMVESDQFGCVWLSERGLLTLTRYQHQHHHDS